MPKSTQAIAGLSPNFAKNYKIVQKIEKKAKGSSQQKTYIFD